MPPRAPLAIAPRSPRSTSSRAPTVLILTPVKDGLPHLETYFAGLARLEFPPGRLALAMLESDSVDGTYAALKERLGAAGHLFARVELFKRDYNALLVKKLGYGSAMNPLRLTAESVARVLSEKVLPAREGLAGAQALIQKEDGLGRACQLIEERLEAA